MRLHKLLLLVVATFLASCSNDDDSGNTVIVEGNYDNGILVLNEGGLGEVTFVSDDLNTVSHDIFTTVNGQNLDLGAYLQSMFFDGDRAFIISNGSNKITVVNRYTFEYIATIDSGLIVPRYGVVSNGKAYVTNSNTFSSTTDDFIAVIDLSTYQVSSTIEIQEQAERLVAFDGKLYVSGGFYGEGDKITVVNAASEQIVTKITVPTAPNSLQIGGGTLHVLSGSFTNSSALTRINLNDNTISNTITLPSSMNGAQNLVFDNNKIYFTANAKIYSYASNVSSITDTPLVNTQSTSAYIGYGFAVHNNRIFIAEAADDFASDGQAFVYDLNGNFVKTFPTGLGPNGFYFN